MPLGKLIVNSRRSIEKRKKLCLPAGEAGTLNCGRWTGFTLVEIMIVVTILGILAAIVAPYYVRAREEAKAKACICNLKEIEGAKERWAISMDVDRWAVPEWTELVPDFLKTEPHCPAGGTYAIGDSHTIPTCDIGSNETAEKYDDHILYNQ